MPKNGEWAQIPNIGGWASRSGDIISHKGKTLRQWREGGIMRVRLNGRNRSVAHLVLSAFTGLPLCAGYFPRHRNRKTSDNRLENLMWAGRPKTE